MSTLRNIALAASALTAALAATPASAADQSFSVVLVHGGFVDGSGWQAVHQRLVRNGYDVVVVQNPTFRWPTTLSSPSARSPPPNIPWSWLATATAAS